MLTLRKLGILVLALSFTAYFSLSASGDVLFQDDLEEEDIGDEPSLWNMVPGFTLQVVEDPQDAGNKVLLESGEANGLGPPTPIGWEDQNFWTDYIWEFDWMWETDVYAGTAHRYQGAGGYYHASRRMGGAELIIYMWNGNFNNLQGSPWQSSAGTWYRMQISAIGNEHIVKGKESDDDTAFDDLDPIASIENDTFADGTIGLFGAEGALYWDNIIVYEPGTDLSEAVEPANKLAVSWGRIKVSD